MPRVPEYQQSELLRPANRQGVDVRASPEAFGAGVGRALQGFGQAVGDAADTMTALQQLEDENAAREATNAASDDLMSVLYDPQTGYKNMSGKNALDARQPTMERIQEIRRKRTEGLTGGAAKAANRAFDELQRDAARTVTLHAGAELKSHTVSTIESASASYQNQALLNFGDKPLFDKYTAAALGSVDRMAELQGWSDEERTLKRQEVQSSITKRAAMRVAEEDPLAVEEYIEANADNLTATDRYDLETGLSAKIEAAKDERDLLGLIDGDITNARTPVEEFIDSVALADTMILAESGGRTNAANPNSTAEGAGQFLAGTWVEQVRKHKPGLAAGMSDADILRLRTDGSPEGQRLQREIINGYARENAKVLQRAGLPVTPASLHMAHFLGASGASAVLSASDDTPLTAVASLAAREANPEVFSSNRTVGDLKTWAADRAMNTAVRGERVLEGQMSGQTGRLALERAPDGYWHTDGVEYALNGKTRSKPVSKQFLERVIPALRQIDPNMGIVITSGGQAQKGTGGPRTGSTRHDVDHTGHSHTADFVVTQNGRQVRPDENPALYAQVLENMAAAGVTGIGHYAWGIHVGGGSEAAWGPDTSSATLDPMFAEAIERGRARRQTGGGIRPQPNGSLAVSASTIEQRAASIQDPIRRAKLVSQAYAILGTETERRTAVQTAARDQAWSMILNGAKPKDLPAELLTTMGPSNFSSLSSAADAWDANPETDPILLYDIRRQQGNDPQAFAERNLLEDFASGKLSREDFDSIAKEQSSALSDKRKATQDSFNISTAMSIADAQLEAVGIKKTPSKMKEADLKRVAQFQNALMSEMQAFQQANERQPSQPEVQSMINRMLLPVVTSQSRTYQPFYPFGDPVTTVDEGVEGFMFEAPFRPDGTSVDIRVEYSDVPVVLREGITRDLALELGRKPTPDEVVERYEQFVMTR